MEANSYLIRLRSYLDTDTIYGKVKMFQGHFDNTYSPISRSESIISKLSLVPDHLTFRAEHPELSLSRTGDSNPMKLSDCNEACWGWRLSWLLTLHQETVMGKSKIAKAGPSTPVRQVRWRTIMSGRQSMDKIVKFPPRKKACIERADQSPTQTGSISELANASFFPDDPPIREI